MRASRFNEGQIIAILREQEGGATADVLEPECSVNTGLSLDDCPIGIDGINFVASKNGQVGGPRVDTNPPTGWRASHLEVIAPVDKPKVSRRLNRVASHRQHLLVAEEFALRYLRFVSKAAKACFGLIASEGPPCRAPSGDDTCAFRKPHPRDSQ
jgi:hypothetical protein